MGRFRDAVRRLGVVRALLAFLWRERLWWMIPILLTLVLLGLVLVFVAPAVSPFVYILF